MENSIKYVILDFGKVIAAPTTGNWFITPKFIELVDMSKIDVELFNEKTKLFSDILSKKIRTIEEEYLMFFEFYGNVLRSLDYPDATKDLIQKLAMDITYESTKYTMYPNVIEELDRLKKDYVLILLTDNWPCVRRILKEYGIYNCFDNIYVSSELGCEKKDGLLFDFPITNYGIEKGEAVFVDDNEKLLDIAQKKGLDTRLMVRDANRVVTSKHTIINNLDEIFSVKHR